MQNHRNKSYQKITKIMYLETRDKMEFIDINSRFFGKKWIYNELLKIKSQKIPEMNTSKEIFKLTGQMISKSYNLYINENLRTREI